MLNLKTFCTYTLTYNHASDQDKEHFQPQRTFLCTWKCYVSTVLVERRLELKPTQQWTRLNSCNCSNKTKSFLHLVLFLACGSLGILIDMSLAPGWDSVWSFGEESLPLQPSTSWSKCLAWKTGGAIDSGPSLQGDFSPEHPNTG